MTPEAEKYRAQLREMMPELAQRFGVAELGLFGSRVRGDNRPDSDLDVLVVSRRATTRAEKQALVDRLLSLSQRPRHLELTIVADWALERLPEEHGAVLTRARAIYLGQEPERWDDLRSQVRPHADHVVGQIEKCG